MKQSRNHDNHYKWGGICDGWRLVDDRNLSIIEERMPPGSSERKHYHEVAKQFFYVLSGRLSISVDRDVVELVSGEGAEIEPGTVHQVKNSGDVDATFLVISSPTTRGDRIEIS